MDKYAGRLSGDVYMAPSESAVHSMYAMTRCDSIVLSRSRFSWWAAYLAESERGIFDGKSLVSGVDVIAPKMDNFSDSSQHKLYYFPHWIILDDERKPEIPM